MDELVSLLADLVSIDSVNPDLVPGGSGEAKIAAFISEWLERKGLEVHLEETSRQGRRNVVAVARGRGAGRSLLLNAHMDTVGVVGMKEPFSAEVREGRLYGRGAVDTKGALAAYLCAAADVKALGLPGDVVLTAVVDEEYASAGTEAVARKWKTDAAIVGEPSGLEVVTAHKGFVWFDLETQGVAAHGSLPEVGVDAIARMGRVLVGLEAMETELATGRRHPILGPASIHASLIQGGQELSSYPARCKLSIERRTIPGERPHDVEGGLREMLGRLERTDPTFKATLRRTFSRDPMEARLDSPIVLSLARQVSRLTGRDAVFSGMSGWLDSALLSAAGIETVVLGPSGEGLHGETEWVDLPSVRLCREIIRETAVEFCSVRAPDRAS